MPAIWPRSTLVFAAVGPVRRLSDDPQAARDRPRRQALSQLSLHLPGGAAAGHGRQLRRGRRAGRRRRRDRHAAGDRGAEGDRRHRREPGRAAAALRCAGGALQRDQDRLGPGQPALGQRRRRIRDLSIHAGGRQARSAPPDWHRSGGGAVAIRGILFDKDGTVIDYWRTWVPINREVGAVRGRRRRRAGRRAAAARRPRSRDRPDHARHGAGGRQRRRHRRARSPRTWAPARRPTWRPASSAIFRARRRPALGADRRARARPSPSSSGAASASALATNDSMGGLEASLRAARHPRTCSTSPWVAIPGFGSKPDPRMVLGFCEAVGVDRRARSPWSAMRCTTSPWAARRGWP